MRPMAGSRRSMVATEIKPAQRVQNAGDGAGPAAAGDGRRRHGRWADPAVETMGAMWSDIILEGCGRLAALDPDRVTALSYEALTADPRGSLRRLAAFIGVAEDQEWVSA